MNRRLLGDMEIKAIGFRRKIRLFLFFKSRLLLYINTLKAI